MVDEARMAKQNWCYTFATGFKSDECGAQSGVRIFHPCQLPFKEDSECKSTARMILSGALSKFLF